MNREEIILEIIQRITEDLGATISMDTELMDTGVVDSVFIMELVAELEDRFGIEIAGEDILPDYFENVSQISKMIGKYLNE